jgi:hypothetical protein
VYSLPSGACITVWPRWRRTTVALRFCVLDTSAATTSEALQSKCIWFFAASGSGTPGESRYLNHLLSVVESSSTSEPRTARPESGPRERIRRAGQGLNQTRHIRTQPPHLRRVPALSFPDTRTCMVVGKATDWIRAPPCEFADDSHAAFAHITAHCEELAATRTRLTIAAEQRVSGSMRKLATPCPSSSRAISKPDQGTGSRRAAAAITRGYVPSPGLLTRQQARLSQGLAHLP